MAILPYFGIAGIFREWVGGRQLGEWVCVSPVERDCLRACSGAVSGVMQDTHRKQSSVYLASARREVFDERRAGRLAVRVSGDGVGLYRNGRSLSRPVALGGSVLLGLRQGCAARDNAPHFSGIEQHASSDADGLKLSGSL